MRSVRFSIAGLMVVVLLSAIGMAALRGPSQTWAGVLLLATLASFCIAVVGAFCRSGAARGGWIGFAVFGWVYMSAAFKPHEFWPKLPTQSLLELLASRIGGPSGPFPAFGGSGGMGGFMRNVGGFGGTAGVIVAEPFFRIGHCLFAILAAILGALLGNRLFGAAVDQAAANIVTAQAVAKSEPRLRKWWVMPLVFMMSSLALVALISTAGAKFPPRLWAGSTFLLTWILIGLVALRALFGRVSGREAWLGATLFGAGFMLLPFGRFSGDPWPRPPTVDFLDEIRPWLPAVANGLRADPASVTAANARLHETLKQHVPVHFLEETPLEDVVKSIQTATQGADGKGIPIYVDPIGLSKAKKTMTSTLRNVELDGVPLRTSLRHCLKQLDLTYSVRDGLLLTTTEESHDASFLSAAADAFQVVGHCVLALIAAGIGGLAAPLVCGLAHKPAI